MIKNEAKRKTGLSVYRKLCYRGRQAASENQESEDNKMAWYEVKHACGHAGEYYLVGHLARRQLAAENLELEKCMKCRKNMKPLTVPRSITAIDMETSGDYNAMVNWLKDRGYELVERGLQVTEGGYRIIFYE